MRLPSRLVFVFVCLLFSTPAWAQAPFAYVSTGPSSPSQIYSINTSTGTTTLLVSTSTSGADYEGLVVLPDNASADNPPNPTVHSFLVYACDTANGNIIRFDPATPVSPTSPMPIETIYSGGAALKHPQCGRGTSSGDLIVTDTGSGSGWWIFSKIANTAFNPGAGPQTPSLLKSATGLLEGTAVKNIGDLLIVDHAGNQVLRSPAPLYSTATTPVFIPSSEGLSSPFGIARRSDGQIYVSNQASKPFIEHFEASGSVATSCQSLTFDKKDTLNFMQMSPGDTLFVAGATGNSPSSGALFQVDAVDAASPGTGCLSLTKTFSPGLPPLVGVALALPNFSASRSICIPSNGGCNATANFGYAALEAINASGSCNLTVTATPTPPAILSGDIGTNPAIAAAPAVDLGGDGFETVVNPFPSLPAGCAAVSDGLFHYLLSVNVPSTVTNPLTIFCPTPTVANPSPLCESTLENVYPLGGLLPSDITSGGKKPSCTIFTANSTPSANKEPGTFCLYESPVNNTNEGQPASSLPVGNQLNVKFKLASAQGNCQSGPYITDATALLSVAQIKDSMGNPVFVPFTIVLNGIVSQFYNLDKTTQQYGAKWDTSQCILPSGVTEDCPQGTYSLTTVFTSNNTSPPDSIYTTQTTLLTIGKQH